MTQQTIVIDPEVMMGAPHVSGTGLKVEGILEELGVGGSVDEVVAAHPGLTKEGVLAAVLYGAFQVRYGWDELDRRGLSARQIAFVGALTYAFPVLEPLLQEHLEDNEGEILGHPFVSAVERWLESEWRSGAEVVTEVFAWLEMQYAQGDPEVVELLSDSFIEMLPYPGSRWSGLRNLLGPTMAARDAELLGVARERAKRAGEIG